jgi:Protein of unknown function (DUF3987)
MRRHRDWIAAYLDTVVPKSESPERFNFWCAASVIAGALRRRVYIEMEAFRWYSNLYVVLVAPPGTVKKSTTINIGMRLLRELPNINFGSDISTWEGFIEQVEDAKDMFAEGDPRPYLTLDSEHAVTSALTLAISEWGTFLDPQNYQMINMLTELYDGKTDIPLTKKTKTQGTNTIINPFINMIAGTTPDWMNDNFRGKFGGWGFSSRCIFLHCTAPERLIPYTDEQWQGTFRATMEKLSDDLRTISELSGPYTITPDARAFGRAWYATHMDRKIQLDRHPHHDPWLSYYLARKFDHAHKLAIILAASRRDPLRIELDDLRDACARCDEVENELASIFGTHGSATRSASLNMDVWRALESMISKNGGGIPEPAAYSFTLRYMTYGETKQFFDHLIVSKWLVKEVDGRNEWLKIGPAAERAEALQ